MRNNKKGAELSMNVIIVAAIALMVLVVLSIIFMGRAGKFATESNLCSNNGGACVNTGTCTGAYQKVTTSGVCLDAAKKLDTTKECCITVAT